MVTITENLLILISNNIKSDIVITAEIIIISAGSSHGFQYEDPDLSLPVCVESALEVFRGDHSPWQMVGRSAAVALQLFRFC